MMRESVCALQEDIFTNDPSLFEMASQNLSSIFLIFFFLASGFLPGKHRRRLSRLHHIGIWKIIESNSQKSTRATQDLCVALCCSCLTF